MQNAFEYLNAADQSLPVSLSSGNDNHSPIAISEALPPAAVALIYALDPEQNKVPLRESISSRKGV